MAQSSASASSTQVVPTSNALPTYTRLLLASASPATWSSYRNTLQVFQRVCPTLNLSFPMPVVVVIQFICSLYDAGYAPSSITSFVSHLSYFNKIHGAPPFHACFIVSKLLIGARRLSPRSDHRRPVTLDILHKIYSLVPSLWSDQHVILVIRASILLLFHAFLRVGEITVRAPQAPWTNLILTKDVQFLNPSSPPSQPPGLTLTIRNSKHHFGANFVVRLSSIPSTYCPVRAIYAYSLFSPSPPNSPLFHNRDLTPITRFQMSHWLSLLFSRAGLPTAFYKAHSFRIGAATHALVSSNLPLPTIQRLGRWSSDAFKNYLRP